MDIKRTGLTLHETVLFNSIKSYGLMKRIDEVTELLTKIYSSPTYKDKLKQYQRTLQICSITLMDLKKEFCMIEKLELVYTIIDKEEKRRSTNILDLIKD